MSLLIKIVYSIIVIRLDIKSNVKINCKWKRLFRVFAE